MRIYLALTTTNFSQNGYTEIARGSNKKDVAQEALSKLIGDDIYTETKRINLIVVSKTKAKKDYGIDIDSHDYIESQYNG